MKKNTESLITETYYHIYNRGINGTSIFNEDKNYYYFLKLYSKYIPLVADTYAYCLLGNHFHLLIRTKSEQEILNNATNPNVKGVINPFDVRASKSASFYISNQFAKLFNSYTQSFNKMYNRTGSLFEHPFRRIPVFNNQYYTGLIYYIHSNPQKHGICDDFTHYPYSSYSAFLLQKKTRLMRNQVLDWFGNKEQFVKFHEQGNIKEVINL